MLFTVAGRRAGAFALNHARITLAFVFLSVLVLLTRGSAWAPGAGFEHVGFLMLSGVVGITLGDWAYFHAFVLVGPRLTTVLMTLAPPLTALIAIPLLGEHLGLPAVFGMALTIGGVLLVILERQPAEIPQGHRVQGAILGALGSLGQALGLVLSKIGMGEVVDPLPATAIRMAAATAGIWILAMLVRRVGQLGRLLRDRTARLATLGATVLGPVCGIWLSLVAVRHTEAGVAATLLATTPVLILPLVMFFNRERVTFRAAIGAVVSVAGVAVLFLR